MDITEQKRVGLVLISNRATNDLTSQDTGVTMLRRIGALADELNDMDDMRVDDWPVHTLRLCDMNTLVMPDDVVMDRRAIELTRSLLKKNMVVPLVVADDGRVINGKYRYIAAKQEGFHEYPVVTVESDLAEFVDIALNGISMDFDSANAVFEDFLRVNAYRRPKIDRAQLPRSFRFWVNGERTLVDTESFDDEFYQRFKAIHGTEIIDFGAGKARTGPRLAVHGIRTASFEPYVVPDGSNKPDAQASCERARHFLEELNDGRVIDSIFLSSVLNSIPHPRDRMIALAVVHGLCSIGTRVYGTMRHAKRFNYVNTGLRQEGTYVWGGEMLTKMGDSFTSPKLQKYLFPEDIEKLLRQFWTSARTWDEGSGGINIFFWRAQGPKRVNPEILTKALEFEFNLPYEDGSRMGLSSLAIEVFSSRLDLDLAKHATEST